MSKVKITADAVLQIVQGIFSEHEVNVVVTDPTVPEWNGKRVQDILNVQYYTFKHRPASTQAVMTQIFEQQGQVNRLEALNRSFCLLSLGKIERLYSKDEDMGAINATLEYYIQSDKVKLLEKLIDDSSAAVSGTRLNVTFIGDEGKEESRRAVVFWGSLRESDVMPTTPYGEMIGLEVNVTIMFYEDVASYSDYEVSFSFFDKGEQKVCAVPLKSIAIANTMTQDSIPAIANRNKVTNVNLSAANSFVLVMDGYNNDFINYITDLTLRDSVQNNNESFVMKLIRRGKEYEHTVIIKSHQITVNADTGNETHTLTLVRYEDNGRL